MSRYKIIFYKTSSNNDIIVDFIRSFSIKEITKIHNDLDRLSEYGLLLLHTSLVKKIHRNPSLFELRIKTTKEIRLLFSFVDPNLLIFVHGFVKKKNKLPQKDLITALKRLRELM